jgi:hypothetical protein
LLDRLAEAGTGVLRIRAEQRGSTTSNRTPTDTDNGTIKDPAEWTTGDEPMTGAQDSYLHTLARKAGEEAEASMKIDELREKTGVANAPAKPKRKDRK